MRDRETDKEHVCVRLRLDSHVYGYESIDIGVRVCVCVCERERCRSLCVHVFLFVLFRFFLLFFHAPASVILFSFSPFCFPFSFLPSQVLFRFLFRSRFSFGAECCGSCRVFVRAVICCFPAVFSCLPARRLVCGDADSSQYKERSRTCW